MRRVLLLVLLLVLQSIYAADAGLVISIPPEMVDSILKWRVANGLDVPLKQAPAQNVLMNNEIHTKMVDQTGRVVFITTSV
jgi:hypothetical protein